MKIKKQIILFAEMSKVCEVELNSFMELKFSGELRATGEKSGINVT